MQYLLKSSKKEDTDLWELIKKHHRVTKTPLNIIIFKALRGLIENNSENSFEMLSKKVDELKKEVDDLKKSQIRENASSTIVFKTPKKESEGIHTKGEKDKLIESINKLKGKMTIEELCNNAKIETYKKGKGLRDFNYPELEAIRGNLGGLYAK